ncbi:LOW QUALITY PROTEIN: probable G-protein coupled receptor 179 [Xyrichtys novacula]|uniref:LOW QUALITY PROTEIN: probable G-protein coupled receptor 179 n=1 Tax=Xyrichtys novacula TaxID=13765 RepID=A0AAV1EZD8_XYRNO|nr:LOW QUALITY PROTEIN: probable G-protein coupled receptor 179 [Xyrichtys novacula]
MSDFRMAPPLLLLLLLLLPDLLEAQLTPNSTSGVTEETNNRTTESPTDTTGSLDPPGSPSSSLSPPQMSSEPPTDLEEDWSPAETFLYTGDLLTLVGGRCSRPYSPPGQTGSLPASFSAPLRPALDALANTANFLNLIFQASDLRESTVQEDLEWYHALVRALLEADLLIQRALLTFDADPTAPVPQLVLRASRDPVAKIQTSILQDLSKSWELLHPPAPAPDDSWFRSFKFPESRQTPPVLSKRVLLNDLDTLETPKWRRGDSYVTNRSGVRWSGAPFLDCRDGRFVPGWMLTLSTSFYGLKPDLTPEFRGVIRVDVKIQDIDLNQCATGDGWFADTHQCNRTNMECVPIPGRGFRLGQYCCRCREGYYNPETLIQDLDGGPVNRSEDGRACYPNLPVCLPCWPGCRSCQDGSPCWVQEAWLLRAAVLAVQGVFMLLIFVSMLVAYRHRRNRRIRASGLLLLETILFGSLLLYFPVFIMYFKPSTFRCILLRWVRMLGFSIVYGTVTLKMYRVLKVFLSRTAQRVPYMSSLHLLRILGVMLMTVSWFLCAWTVGVLQNRDRNIPVFITTSTSDGQGFNLCFLDRWDYMMAVAELLFLCWGSSLWTAVRPVPSAFHEPRYMGIAIHNELLLSTMFHLFRFTFPSLHPDWMLLLSFTHTHVTITVTLALLFIPKFLFASRSGKEEIAAEVYEDEVDLRRSGSYLNSSFHSAWSEPSVDPDDFRDELKKLYAQLEVHKTKKMAANNPHLSKKRSSRCALGRSIIRRIVEIPETVSRQCSREERDGSFHSRRLNESDSFRTAPDTASISYRSSIKSPSPPLRKSQSDYHYVRERNASLRDSLLNANSGKRFSQRSETDSLDIPPGVCKSASAQNLTIDTNLLHPDHTRLHKSWSLTSTAPHSIESMSLVNRSNTVLAPSRQSIPISDQTRSALQSESFDKAEVCPWEVEQEQTSDKNQKHVTYANSQDSSEKGPASPEVLICPWDHLPPPEQSPPEEKALQSETIPAKQQLTVSASEPGSPRPKVTKEQRVFSFRTPTSKWLSVKSIMGSMDAGNKSGKDGGSNKEDSVSQKSQESASTTPRSSASSRRPSTEKKTLQKRSLTTADGKPCLVKQNAIRLSSGDSSDRSPRRLVIVKSAVYPWDLDDMQKDGNYENVFLSRQNSKRSVSSWETSSSCRTPSTHRRGSNRITPVRNVSHVDVCPWEAAGTFQEGEGQRKQQSIKADVCPWESQVSEQSNVCPWESQEHEIVRRQGSGRGDVCPWESQDIPVIYQTNVPKDSVKGSDICPWDTAETPQPSKLEDNEYANICPWDVQDKAEAVYENLNPLVNTGSLTVPLQQGAMTPAIHPGASKEVLSNEQQYHAKSTAQHLGRQATKTAESCPWEFPAPPEITETICPWEEGSTGPTNTDSNLSTTVQVDVCPWESGQRDEPLDSKTGVSALEATPIQTEGECSSRLNICPWETDAPEKTVETKIMMQGQKRPEDVSPESGIQPTQKTTEYRVRQDTVCADVCPWDTEETGAVKSQVLSSSEKLQRQKNSKEDVCPWETEAPKDLKRQDSSRVEVCPWETEDTKVGKKQESLKEEVCPWDSDAPKVLKKQESSRTDVCPWETDDPNILKKQDSSREEVCPWETDDSKVLKKQDSARASVCPWETEQPEVLKRQDSSRTDVCPWETEEPKDLKKQDSTRADVCPWDTEEPEPVKKSDSSGAEGCPWESEDQDIPTKSNDDNPTGDKDHPPENQATLCVEESPVETSKEQTDGSKEGLALGRRDALCPWEVARSPSGSFTDNTSDVFTWEPENIPEEDEEDDAECAAEALVFPPDL